LKYFPLEPVCMLTKNVPVNLNEHSLACSLCTMHKYALCYYTVLSNYYQTRMWANAQRDGRPAEYRWRPLFNPAVWLTSTTRVSCSNAAKTRNPLKLLGVPQTNETISATSGPKFTILWGHVEEILLLNKFFFRLSIHAFVAKV